MYIDGNGWNVNGFQIKSLVSCFLHRYSNGGDDDRDHGDGDDQDQQLKQHSQKYVDGECAERRCGSPRSP